MAKYNLGIFLWEKYIYYVTKFTHRNIVQTKQIKHCQTLNINFDLQYFTNKTIIHEMLTK